MMIKLIITIFGGLMIIAGFYAMYWGFAIPPNIFLFFIGLILAVAGLFLIIMFSSGIEMPERKISTTPRTVPSSTPIMKARPKPVKVEKEKVVSKEVKKKETLKTIEKIKPQTGAKEPKKVERPEMSTKPRVEKSEKSSEPIGTREIKPKKKTDIGKTSTLPPQPAFQSSSAETKKTVEKPVKPEAEKSEPAKPRVEPPKPDVQKTEPPKPVDEKVEPAKPKDEKTEQAKPKPVPRITRPDKKQKESDIIVDHVEEPAPEPEETGSEEEEPKKIAPVETDEHKKTPVLKRPDLTKLKSNSTPAKEQDTYVKQRLERMKESYIQNTKDIESIIDERMDSFKGTLGKLKSESKEPGIIWSFDADDVQDAMKDTISKAGHRILMMYPWIRNIDVGILKKFMETECRIIVQEASLDDDASVELLKLLQDKEVKIRTMPHVHTIAVVADDSNGLIISTDPIYESYEVGVIYKDQKSIEEIERLFEDAWDLSQEIDLEIK
jgi:hypothetical protein